MWNQGDTCSSKKHMHFNFQSGFSLVILFKMITIIIFHYDMIGEDENAYVLFWKYVEIYNVIKKHPEYSKDQKYYDGRC